MVAKIIKFIDQLQTCPKPTVLYLKCRVLYLDQVESILYSSLGRVVQQRTPGAGAKEARAWTRIRGRKIKDKSNRWHNKLVLNNQGCRQLFVFGGAKKERKVRDLRGAGGYAPRKILTLRSSESESDTFREDYDRA